jgi:luciferase-type oxidoreductase
MNGNPSYMIVEDLSRHRAYARVFQPGSLTIGFIAPLEGYPNAPWPTLENHETMVEAVDAAGFAALWLRDVPFYDPNFGDVGQLVDPMVYAGWIAAQTKSIAIGTAGIVLPLRDPIAVAKQAASMDLLSGGRFLLGLSTGDRASEYAAFGSDIETRAERYQDALEVIKAATETSFPQHASAYYGTLQGNLDLLPKPNGGRLPIIAIGRAGQSLDWLARNTDGWIWHMSDFRRLADVVQTWREAGAGLPFKPYGYGAMFDLAADPNAPLEIRSFYMRSGRNALIELWKRQRDEGVNHVALNPKPLQRPFAEVMDELATHVLPCFPTSDG